MQYWLDSHSDEHNCDVSVCGCWCVFFFSLFFFSCVLNCTIDIELPWNNRICTLHALKLVYFYRSPQAIPEANRRLTFLSTLQMQKVFCFNLNTSTISFKTFFKMGFHFTVWWKTILSDFVINGNINWSELSLQGSVLPICCHPCVPACAAGVSMPSCGKRPQEADYLNPNPMKKDTIWALIELSKMANLDLYTY